MSGGAYNYAYAKVQEFAEALRAGQDYDGVLKPDQENLPDEKADAVRLREKFSAHLLLVAEAMKAIEWTDSGDSGLEDEREAIEKCLGVRR